MNQIHSFLFFGGFIALFSCTRSLEIDFPEEPPRLVIWGDICRDSLIRVQLYRTYSPLDTTTANQTVPGALVVLWEDQVPVDTLQDLGAGQYRTVNKRPESNKSYYLTAYKTGFPDLTTPVGQIPEPIHVIDSSVVYAPYPQETNLGSTFITLRLAQAIDSDLIGTRVQKNAAEELNLGGWFKPYDSGNDRTLNSYGSYGLEDYSDQRPFSEVVLSNNWTYFDQLEQHGALCSLLAFSNESTDVLIQLGIFNSYNTDTPGVSIFYEPVYLPLEIEGGYGHVFFYTTTQILVRL